MRLSEKFRAAARTAILLACAAALFAGPLPTWLLARVYSGDPHLEEIAPLSHKLIKLIPEGSAYSGAASALAGGAAAGLVAAGLFVIVSILWGRFFCRWMCPTGTLLWLASRFNFGKVLLRRRISGWIFWAGLSSAALGFPFLLFLDPLATFSRLGVFLNNRIEWAGAALLLLLLLFVLLGLFQPMIWCSHVCPLGYFATLLSARRGPGQKAFGKEALAEKVDKNRRDAIGGLLLGIPAALALKNLFGRAGGEKRLTVLPPNAGNHDRYHSLCTRCYACVNACPSGTLSVRMPSDGDVGGWFAPVVDASKGPCEEFCLRCSEVCPTGAIRLMKSAAEKRRIQMGVAEVRKDACLAWNDNEHCIVCDEYCPYRAFDVDTSPAGIPRPVVKEDVCRGCGYCEKYCPAVKKGVAIVVRGVGEQRTLKG